MKHPSMPGTRSWLPVGESPSRRRSGSISVLSALLYLLVSIIGLGLIAVSQLHTKFSGLKKDRALLSYAAENGIKQGFESTARRVGAVSGPAVLTEDEFLVLKSDSAEGGAEIVKRLLGAGDPPVGGTGSGETQFWEFTLSFAQGAHFDRGDYFLSVLPGRIDSTGWLAHRLPRKKASLDFMLRVAAGRLPLSMFPFLVAGDLGAEKEAQIRADANLSFAGAAKDDARPRMTFTGPALMPVDPGPILKKALQVKLLSPDTLTRAEIRAALGLEMVDEPVPEGVYLIRNTNGLGGIYVQGDLQEVLLAIEHGWQDVFFVQSGSTWALKFNPSLGRTIFESPAGAETFDFLPLAIIMIAGKVDALGGGTVDTAGAPAFLTDEPIPCILGGISLTIVSTDRIEISAHLVQEGVRWTDGIPYLKDSTSQLAVWATGDLAVKPTGRDIQIQASLTAGKAISVASSGNNVVLAGGLQAGGFELGSNQMTIVPDERALSPDAAPAYAPQSASPVFLVLSLRALQWND